MILIEFRIEMKSNIVTRINFSSLVHHLGYFLTCTSQKEIANWMKKSRSQSLGIGQAIKYACFNYTDMSNRVKIQMIKC